MVMNHHQMSQIGARDEMIIHFRYVRLVFIVSRNVLLSSHLSSPLSPSLLQSSLGSMPQSFQDSPIFSSSEDHLSNFEISPPSPPSPPSQEGIGIGSEYKPFQSRYQQPQLGDLTGSLTPPPRGRMCFLLWDLVSCPLTPSDSVSRVVENSIAMLREHMNGQGRSLRKVVFVPTSTENISLTEQQRMNLDQDFCVAFFSDLTGVDAVIAQEIDSIIRAFPNNSQKPCVCMLSGRFSINNHLARLILADINDLILVQNFYEGEQQQSVEAREAMMQAERLTTKLVPWGPFKSHILKQPLTPTSQSFQSQSLPPPIITNTPPMSPFYGVGQRQQNVSRLQSLMPSTPSVFSPASHLQSISQDHVPHLGSHWDIHSPIRSPPPLHATPESSGRDSNICDATSIWSWGNSLNSSSPSHLSESSSTSSLLSSPSPHRSRQIFPPYVGPPSASPISSSRQSVGSACATATASTMAAATPTPPSLLQPSPLLSSDRGTTSINLQLPVIAAHMKNLMYWGALDDDVQVRDKAFLSLNVDSGSNKQELLVTGSLTARVVKVEVVREMINACLRYRNLCQLPSSWEIQHKEAIEGSAMLQGQEKLHQGTALFSVSEDDGRVVVDIVSHKSATGVKNLADFLLNLSPRRAVWTVPQECLAPYTPKLLVALRERFASKIVVCSKRASNAVLEAFGFGALPDKALEFILSGDVKELGQQMGTYERLTCDTGGVNTANVGGKEDRSGEVEKEGAPTPSKKGTIASPSTTDTSTTPTASPQKSASGPQTPLSLSVTNYSAAVKKGGTPSSSPMSQSVSPRHYITGSFTFQDREAGIHYAAFENEYRAFLSHSFHVQADRAQQLSESGTSPKHHQQSQSQQGSYSGTQTRTPALKVTFKGSNRDDVNNARIYLEKLNTSNLERYQVFFPQASSVKVTELDEHKRRQDEIQASIRKGVAASSASHCCDPLDSSGFINIRLKIQSMQKVAKRSTMQGASGNDVTVTICGPVTHEIQLQQLRAVEASFNRIDSGFVTRVFEVPISSKIAKDMTARTTRDDVAATYKLVAIKWLEEGSRNTGGMSLVKVWSRSQKTMNVFSDVISAGGGHAVSSDILHLDWEKRVASMGRSSGWGGDENAEGQLSGGGVGQRVVIYWPIQSCRYIFLGESLKKQLSDLLNHHREKGIIITSPYRDKNQPLACMLLEGSAEVVKGASEEINRFLQEVTMQVHAACVTLSEPEWQNLTQRDLVKMKEIQGICGVHISLEPTPEELSQALSNFDLRLPYTLSPVPEDVDAENQLNRSLQQALYPSISPSLSEALTPHPPAIVTEDNVLISVGVPSIGSPRHQVQVSVLATNKEGEWITGVDNLLMLTDDTCVGNQPDEDSKLDQGKCLVTRLEERQLIRVKLQNDKSGTSTEQSLKDRLINALSRGLTFVDSQRITCVGVMCPTSLPCLSDVSSRNIRQAFIEAMVAAIQKCSLPFIKRVMCVEMNSAEEIDTAAPTATTTTTTSSLATLKPAADNDMAMSLIQQLELSHTPFPSLSAANTATGTDKFTLITCNVGLPMHLQAESLVDSSQQPAHLRILPVASKGPVMVRGLPIAVLQAIECIKRVTAVWGNASTSNDKETSGGAQSPFKKS